MSGHTPEPEAVRAYPTRTLKAIVFSTNPTGRFAEHLRVAREELARRKAEGAE